jgi:hypothetical protein
MAINRFSQSTAQEAFPKFTNLWDGTTATSAFDSLGAVVLTSSTSTVTFSNIPGTYTHLQIRVLSLPTTTTDGSLTLNGNTAVHNHQLYGVGNASTPGVAGIASQGYIDAGGVSTSYPASYIIDILDYANTNKAKTVRSLFGYDYNGSGRVGMTSMLYTSTLAVTQLSFTVRTYGANSSFALYGIK